MEDWLLWLPKSKMWVTALEPGYAAFFSSLGKRVRLGTDGLVQIHSACPSTDIKFFVEKDVCNEPQTVEDRASKWLAC